MSGQVNYYIKWIHCQQKQQPIVLQKTLLNLFRTPIGNTYVSVGKGKGGVFFRGVLYIRIDVLATVLPLSIRPHSSDKLCAVTPALLCFGLFTKYRFHASMRSHAQTCVCFDHKQDSLMQLHYTA